MVMIGWFPLSKFGPDTEVTFQTPTSSVWKVREKLSQHNRQREEFDPQDPEDCPSSAEATFYVQDSQSNLDGAIAYMRVYMQVPVLTTEFEPREVRRRQATCCSHNEVAALKYFHEEGATMTLALLGIKEEVQDDDGVVPGGYIVYMVFQRVSGIKLAESQAAPCPEFPLHMFFRRFERAERDKIREEFAKSYCPLARLNWMPIEPWADHLIWDSASEKLYIPRLQH
ncbi:unnamed protein product [Penicillium salamii]|uniref:Uncharacterized protein n=1 Tax=Penicillium salamii TaxID=1612424 RepID=A0A9W4J5Y4_9EURO|nr:unnamed protein product [Penicillium salamii]